MPALTEKKILPNARVHFFNITPKILAFSIVIYGIECRPLLIIQRTYTNLFSSFSGGISEGIYGKFSFRWSPSEILKLSTIANNHYKQWNK